MKRRITMKKVIRTLLATSILAASLPAVAETKVGFIYVGPKTDYGYNYAQEQGRLYLEEHLENVETVAFENIAENADVQRVMERMVRSGIEVVFPTSYGYLDHAL